MHLVRIYPASYKNIPFRDQDDYFTDQQTLGPQEGINIRVHLVKSVLTLNNKKGNDKCKQTFSLETVVPFPCSYLTGVKELSKKEGTVLWFILFLQHTKSFSNSIERDLLELHFHRCVNLFNQEPASIGLPANSSASCFQCDLRRILSEACYNHVISSLHNLRLEGIIVSWLCKPKIIFIFYFFCQFILLPTCSFIRCFSNPASSSSVQVCAPWRPSLTLL